MSILIVGLGNPGKQYEHTRHNVGEDFIDILADKYGIELKKEKKFLGSYGKALVFNTTLHLLKPDHYMNESGIAVKKTKSFLNIPIDQILIVHDVCFLLLLLLTRPLGSLFLAAPPLPSSHDLHKAL